MGVKILVGDVRARLKDLPDESVHCVVTSPPYFGLRDYGTAQWEGGEADCDHLMPQSSFARDAGRDRTASGGKFHDSPKPKQLQQQFAKECGKCGANRIDSQIGLEPTPDAFVAAMVEVFREVRRVLRKDGTCWVNLGSSYALSGVGSSSGDAQAFVRSSCLNYTQSQFKPKDLIPIPWMVAMALQSDGWWLRQDIIWHKPNPMPESVRDRCTKAHEYLFLLTKSERYWFDQEPVREPISIHNQGEISVSPLGAHRMETGNRVQAKRQYDEIKGANRRSVWSIATQPFSEAHFATFPPELPEVCIKAGCPPQGTVLDPFGGAGTTGLVADRLGRNAILIELNPEYAALARKRIEGDAGMFAMVAAE